MLDKNKMHIGDDENFIRIDGCRIQASASGSGRVFTAEHPAIVIDTSDKTKSSFADFAAFKTKKSEVRLSEGGWLRFSRDFSGAIVISYRVAGWKAVGAMEGQAFVHGEFVDSFHRDFQTLLENREKIELGEA